MRYIRITAAIVAVIIGIVGITALSVLAIAGITSLEERLLDANPQLALAIFGAN